MIKIEKINNSYIAFYSEPSVHIAEYYNYCLSLIRKKLINIKNCFNINFGNFNLNFNNSNKTLNIDIQYEHTLVKDGGRGVREKIYGKISDNNNSKYLVRIDNFHYYNSLDLVIEYSKPNIFNIESSDFYNEYVKKNCYISPNLYESRFESSGRKETITLFTNNPSERRSLFYKNIMNNHVECINVNNCYSRDQLIEQYDKTKILVNIHQTEHHHTFEEIRVLPALRRGVIILSEWVPAVEQIPYNKFIIWSSYENMCSSLLNIQKNYDNIRQSIFNEELFKLLNDMEQNNMNNLDILNEL